MSGPPGYDEESERRQIREQSKKEGAEKLLDDLFFAGIETSTFGLPTLLFLLTAENGVGVKWAGLVSWLTLTVGVGLARGGWVDIGWPSLSAKQGALRVVAYSVLVAAASAGGVIVRSVPGVQTVGTALTAAVVTVVGLWAFARVTSEV